MVEMIHLWDRKRHTLISAAEFNKVLQQKSRGLYFLFLILFLLFVCVSILESVLPSTDSKTHSIIWNLLPKETAEQSTVLATTVERITDMFPKPHNKNQYRRPSREAAHESEERHEDCTN